MPTLSPTATLLSVVLVAVATPARAQSAGATDTRRVVASAAAMAAATPLADTVVRKRKNTIAIGAAIGAAGAAAVTAWAANTYGNNEGGRFCGACFVQWGAIAIPAGAAAGAGIGWAVTATASPNQQPGVGGSAGTPRPLSLSQRRKQLAVTLTF